MLLPTMAESVPTQHAFAALEQPRSYPFIPVQPPASKQKNYVFVDEHNRHKRLKVMRACEGCRRRKIKCDSATTNTWPCAACIRLKLHCVPPSISYEKDSEDGGLGGFELEKSNSYSNSSTNAVSTFQAATGSQQYDVSNMAITSVPDNLSYEYTTPILSLEHYENIQLPVKQYQSRPTVSEHSWAASDVGTTNLADAFGSLQISLEATAPYITDLKQLSESEAVQEQEVDLPNLRGPDNKIRIPPEMMPSEHLALQHFEYFFANVHPFVPVVNPTTFYQAWTSHKESISPLLLEAMFACVAALMGKNDECARWLALASRHEESYKDVPRLSTLQSQILLLKAKEAQPSKRGYFYRSWVNLVSAVGMAKDLELDKHLSRHQNRKECGSRPSECLSKTRIWQWLFVMETIIGGSQKRLDFSTHEDSVDFSEPQPGTDASEYRISRQYRHFLLAVRNIRHTLRGFIRHHGKGGDWTFHDDYTSVEDEFRTWMADVPDDLRIDFPKDDSLPWIASPFIGFTNLYYHLSIIMHHRPQIHYLMESTNGDAWRPYLITCLAAAKNTSRIMDGIFHTFGIQGLRAMLRGISFGVYAMLTCAMLHLAAITAPDAAINNEAREYFVRGMRLLEHVSPLWPMESVKRQVDALREAFSADTNKPFNLRPGFPFSSPTPPPREMAISATLTQHQSTPLRTAKIVPNGTASPASSSQTPLQTQWNPSNLFNKWTNAFYATHSDAVGEHPSPSLSSEASNLGAVSNGGAYGNHVFTANAYTSTPYPISLSSQTSLQQTPIQQTQQQHQQPQQQSLLQQPPPNLSTQPSVSYEMEYMTPAAWQDAVANSFVTGMKRRRYD